MDTRYLGYVDADNDFYEHLWRAVPPDDLLARDASLDHVQVSIQGPFRVLLATSDLPPTGWKVHVSCTPGTCERVVPLAVASSLRLGISCKHLLTRRLVLVNQAKYADPDAAGKVVTAYPCSAAELAALLADLRRVLAGEPGCRVLSDIPASDAPVSVRYGAFVAAYAVDGAGRLRPGRLVGDQVETDNRAAHSCQARLDEPEVVTALRLAAAARDAEATLPVTGVTLLHRSNAGGVYSAGWEDGRPVVLKEARHHTGFDRAESDAATRLRHERRVLQRLSGTAASPEVVAAMSVGSSDFLVMERCMGEPLTMGMATRHPAAVPGADPVAYRDWVDRTMRLTRQALERIHRRGVVHLDVHPGNVIDCGDHVRLIDFESAAVDGTVVADGVASALSHHTGRPCREADLLALDRLGDTLLNPLFTLSARRPDLAEELVRAGRHDLAGISEATAGPCTERLLAGLRLAATPDRSELLFPADIAVFGTPGAGVGLLHGAAGVLHALRVTGRPIPKVWRDWLVRAAQSGLPPGLGDGSAGVAVVLAGMGETALAHALLEQEAAPEAAPWWSGGAAGHALARAEVAALTDDLPLARDAAAAARLAVSAPPESLGRRSGLLHGWAGVGLAALRVAEVLAASEAVGSARDADIATLHSGARRAFEIELTQVREVGSAWMTCDHERALPYLGHGSAGLGLLALGLERVGMGDHHTTAAIRGVSGALRVRAVGCAGLMHGRAGLLLAAAVLIPHEEETIAIHQGRMRWYAVKPTDQRRARQPLAGKADFYLGEQNLRASADLATGAAGVLLAAHTGEIARLASALAQTVFLPACLVPRQPSLSEMTAVTNRP